MLSYSASLNRKRTSSSPNIRPSEASHTPKLYPIFLPSSSPVPESSSTIRSQQNPDASARTSTTSFPHWDVRPPPLTSTPSRRRPTTSSRNSRRVSTPRKISLIKKSGSTNIPSSQQPTESNRINSLLPYLSKKNITTPTSSLSQSQEPDIISSIEHPTQQESNASSNLVEGNNHTITHNPIDIEIFQPIKDITPLHNASFPSSLIQSPLSSDQEASNNYNHEQDSYSDAFDLLADEQESEQSNTTHDSDSDIAPSTPDISDLDHTNLDDDEDHIERTTDLLLQLFQLENIGCTSEQHQAKLDEHTQDVDEDSCQGLSTTYQKNGSFIKSSSLMSTTVLGLDNKTFFKPSNYPRGRFIPSPEIQTIFEGRANVEAEVQHVCLHSDYRPSTVPTVEFDMDSTIVFMDSLAAIKTDIRVIYTKDVSKNIKTDLHITKSVPFLLPNGRVRRRMTHLKDLPHLYIGTIPDFPNSSIFWVFPLLATESKSTWLKDRDAQRFFTQTFMPACRAVLSDGAAQYHPPSSQTAEDKSRARGREYRGGDSRDPDIIKQYPIPAAALPAIASRINSDIGTGSNALGDFRYSFLVVDAKNTKIDFKAEALYPTLAKYEDHITRMFDQDMVEIASDTAFEIVPPQPSELGDNGTVLLWKACCLRTLLSHLQTTIFDGKAGRTQIFHNAYLADSTCVTVVPPSKSPARNAGFLYLQAYNSVREVENANKVSPFDRPELVNLAIDPDLYRSTAFPLKRSTLEKGYIACKNRIVAAHRDYRGSSTGTRLEVRNLTRIRHRLLEKASKHAHPLSDIPDCLWAFHMKTWLDFKGGNYDKIISLIDIIVLCSPETGITKGSAQLLFVLLLYLQNFSNSDPRRKSLLWHAERTAAGSTRYGLGLKSTIHEYGFGWMQPIIDWERFAFQPGVENNLLGVGDVIGVCYNDAEATRLQYKHKDLLDVCYSVLKHVAPRSHQERRVMTVMAHLVIRAYRRSVWDIIGSSRVGIVHSDRRSASELDKIQFSYTGLSAAMLQPPYLMTGYRTTVHSPMDIFIWLMTDEGPWNRIHFDGGKDKNSHHQKPWRTMLSQIRQFLAGDPHKAKQWMDTLKQVFTDFMWLIPIPDSNGSIVSTQKGRHRFYSTYVQNVFKNKEPRQWCWYRGDYRPGLPTAWPPELEMGPDQLAAHFGDVSG